MTPPDPRLRSVALRVVTADKRRAIESLCAFAAVLDSCVVPGGDGEAGLERWLAEVLRSYSGRPETAVGRALAETVHEFPIPRSCFESMVAGRRLELAAERIATFADLRLLCEREVSSFGLAAIEVLGYDEPATRDYAAELALAVQLATILNGIAVDATVGRLHLPLEDLAQFDVDADVLLASSLGRVPRPAGTEALLSFEAGRAHESFGRAAALLPSVDRTAMLAAQILAVLSQETLTLAARGGWPLRPVRLSRVHEGWLVLRTTASVLRPHSAPSR